MHNLALLFLFLFVFIWMYRNWIHDRKKILMSHQQNMSESNIVVDRPKYVTQYPWSGQSQQWPFRPTLFDNTNAVMSNAPDYPLLRTYTAEQVFGSPSNCYRDSKQFMIPSANPTFMAPYVPLNTEPAVARAATISSDQWCAKPIGFELSPPAMNLSGL